MKFLIKIVLTVLILGVTLLAKDIATITGLNGQAFIQRDGAKIELSSGDKLQAKDIVITDSKAKVQIIFEDKTVVTVGKNSIFSIDEYLFEENQAPVAKFGMIKGAMRTITGSIGRIAPNKFSVVTKTTTIGIRGTNFSVVIGEDNSHNIYCTYGAISVEFDGEEYIVKQGFYITISANGKVEIREFKPQDLKEMKEKNFGKSVAKVGVANDEGLLDNIKDDYGNIVIQEVALFIEDAKHTWTPQPKQLQLTNPAVIAGFQNQNASYTGTYSTTSNTTINFESSGIADLSVDFGADTASLVLSGLNTSSDIAAYNNNSTGFNTNTFSIEMPLVSSVGPVGRTDGSFYGDNATIIRGTFNFQPDNMTPANEAVGSYNMTAVGQPF